MKLTNLLALSLLAAGLAQAEPLALIHTPSSTCVDDGPRLSCAAGRLDIPKAEDLVAPCADATGCWPAIGDPLPIQRYKDLPATAWIDGCNNPATVRGTALPVPWSAEADPCKTWKIWQVSTFAALEDPSTFASSVLIGPAPLSTVLTWDIANVTSCQASGSWSGTKPIKGTQTITGLTTSATYTLLCTRDASATGSANLSWNAPTQNTDGSPLTNLSGYKILHGPAATQLTQTIAVNDKAATAYTVAGLPINQTIYFAMRAVAGTLESDTTGAVSKLIVPDTSARTFTKTIGVVVNAGPLVPNPPSGLSVTQTVAYRLDVESTANTPRLFVVGTVDIGTNCNKEHRFMTLNRVDNMAVKLNPGARRPAIAWAKCG